MANPIGNMVIRVDLDGSGFNKGIAGLNRQMRMVSREMSASLSKFGRYDQSLEKSKVKVEGLTKRQQVQAQKVKELKQQYDQLSKETGENSAKTQAAAAKYNEAYATLNKYERELEEATEEMKKTEQQQRVLSTSVGKVGQKFSEWGPKLQEIGQKMQSVGRSMSTYITAPVVAGFGAAVKKSIDFDDSMRKVKATSGATGQEFQQLRDKALEMGAKTKFSASQSAEALNYMALAGWDSKEMMSGIDGVMQLAAASGEDLGQVSDIVTDSLTAFGLSAKDSSHFADVLAQTSSKANTDVRGMGDAFKYAAPVAGALGYTVEDTSIAIGLMSNAGIKGEKAGTALRTMFTNLSSPTKAMKDRMDELGISITDSNGKMLPMRDVMDQLRGSFKNLSKDQQASAAATIFGKEAMSGALAIINASDEDYKKLTKSIDNSTGASKRMSDEMEGGIGGSIRQMKSAIESLAISIGDIMAPYIKKLAEWVANAAKQLNEMPKGTQKVVVGLGVVAAAIGPVLVVLGTMVKTIGGSVKVLGSMFKGLAKMTLLTRGANGQIKLFTVSQKVWNGVVKTGKTIADLYRTAVTKLATSQSISTLKTKLAATATKVWTATTKAAALASKGLGLALRFMTGPVGIVITAVGLLVAGVIHLWKTNEGFRNGVIRIWESIKNGISTVVEFIRNFAVNSWNNLKTAGIVIFTLLKTGLTGIFNALKTYFITILTVYKTVFAVTFNAIKAIVTSIIGFIVNFIKNAWNGVKNATVFIFNSLKFFLTQVWNAIKSSIITIVSILYNSVKNIWSSLSRFTKNIFSNLRSFLVNLWSRLKDAVIYSARLLWDGVRKTWNFLLSGTRSIFNRVKSNIVNIWNSIKRSVTGIASSLWNAVRNTFNNMSNGLKSIINRIKDHINGMVNSVKSGLNKLIDGVNWVAGKIGMTKIPRLHTGTTHTTTHNLVTNGKINRDTFATVGDKGRGNGPGGFRHEMIRYPNGKMALTPNRDTTAFLPKGSSVYNGAQTHAMLSQAGRLPRFASGTMLDLLSDKKRPKVHRHGDNVHGDVIAPKAGGGSKQALLGQAAQVGKVYVNRALSAIAKGTDWLSNSIGEVLDWIDKPGELLNKILDAFGVNFDFLKGAEIPYNMMTAIFKKLKTATVKLLTKWLEDSGGGEGGWVDITKGVNFPFSPYGRAPGYPFPYPHKGVDLNYVYDRLYSTHAGTATGSMGYNGGFGNHMRIRSGIYEIIYGHMSKLNWTGSKKVRPGSFLGISGNTGMSSGPHLHYEMRKNGRAIDPMPFLRSKVKHRAPEYATGGLVYDGLYRLGEQGYPEWVIPTDPARASDAAKLIALASKDISKNKRPKNLSTSGINGADSNSSLESKLDVMIGLLIKLVGSNEDIASKDYKPIIDSFGLADFINSTMDTRERQEARKNRFKPGGALI
ncbi:phage tail tape measure protein [Staphylococcus rostri]|uniref:lysostaphin n=1 Tax=Staphylococcus rostri TaxID=522262 RepID=A0A2K3YP74_9STAP|nr:phage tail tape measure protein [Staphylococcus rostri]PNZ27382.1 phage tail tape measure protein [Staphylococcus rostri]